MRPVAVLLPCLALAALTAPAPAAPIRATFEVSNPPGEVPEPRSFSLPLEYGADYGPGLLLGDFGYAPFGPDPKPVSADFRLAVHFDRELEGPVALGAPTLVYDVHMEGTLQAEYPGSGPNAWLEELDISTTLQDWTPEMTIPLPVIEAFRDDASFTSPVFSTSGFNHVHIAFTPPPIAAEYLADPVPEPTTLAAWGVVGLGALAIQHRRRTATVGASVA